ncbi:MAG TPA: hypothetical protein DCP31_39275, partial [Cyanobacteria bacterium UBA8543]|nr:hypothetical protein [Cyanobacteria bacterium UBA8543]
IHLTNLWQLELMEKFNYVQSWIKWQMHKENYQEFLRNQVPEAIQNFDVLEANLQATKDYVALAYPGRVTLFRSTVQKPRFSHDPQLGWGNLVGGELEIHDAPGDHYGMLREP